jgi:hypothetical protein
VEAIERVIWNENGLESVIWIVSAEKVTVAESEIDGEMVKDLFAQKSATGFWWPPVPVMVT